MDTADLSNRDLALFGKLQTSLDDIALARSCAVHIQKRGWHSCAYLRRGNVWLEQISFTTTMIVAYARPFSPGRGNVNFPTRLLQYKSDETALHQRLITLRNQEYAHADASTYTVTPLKSDHIKSIRSIRDAYFSSEQIALFLEMASSVIKRIDERMEQIRIGDHQLYSEI